MYHFIYLCCNTLSCVLGRSVLGMMYASLSSSSTCVVIPCLVFFAVDADARSLGMTYASLPLAARLIFP